MTQPVTPPAALPSTSPLAGARRRKALELWDKAGMVLILFLLVVAVTFWKPAFLSQVNIIRNLLPSVTTVGLIGCTMLFCMAAGDFDLSVGSIVAYTGVVAALVTNHTGSALVGFAAGIAAGGAIGLANGLMIGLLGYNALIATLATMQIVRGLALTATPGSQPEGILRDIDTFAFLKESFPPLDFHLGPLHLNVIGIPHYVLILLLSFLFFGLLLNRTTFGRNTLAIGGNREAARLAGIPVIRTKVIIFALQGVMAGLAGVILASRMQSGDPRDTGQGVELQVIAACVLGGVSMTGGVGSMTAVIVGVLIMGIVENVMGLAGIENTYKYIIFGVVLLAAVGLDLIKQRLQRR